MKIYLLISLLFLAFMVFEYFISQKQGLTLSKNETDRALLFFSAFLVIGIVIRIICAYNLSGYSADIQCFKAWSSRIYSQGFGTFYDPTGKYFCDYPPGYMYVLYLIGFVISTFHVNLNGPMGEFLIKLPAIIFDVLTSIVLCRYCLKHLNKRALYLLTAFVILNPAIIYNSSVWGQVDGIFTFFILLFVMNLASKKYMKATLYFTIALLLKPQAFLFAPIIFFALIFENQPISFGKFKFNFKNKYLIKFTNLISCMLIGFAVFVLFCLPFHNVSLLFILKEKYFGTMGFYNYASVNAFNLYALIGQNFKANTFLFSLLNWIFIAFIFAFVIVLYYKSKNENKTIFLSFSTVLIMFLFLTKMHERYLFPAIILSFLWYIVSKDKRALIATGIISICQYLNMARVLEYLSNNKMVPNDGYVMITALLLLALMVYLLIYAYCYHIKNRPLPVVTEAAKTKSNMKSTLNFKSKQQKSKQQNNIKKSKGKQPIKLPDISPKLVMHKIDVIILVIVILCYAVLSFINLGEHKAPESYLLFDQKGESVTVDLGQNYNIDTINIYSGLYLGSYNLQISNDINDLNSAPVTVLKQGSVFFDQSCTVSKSGRYLKLTANDAPLMLMELVLFDKNAEVPIPSSEFQFLSDVENQQNLFDEQGKVEKMSNYMNGTYFDEIYHARTGYEFLHGFTPYETTHPPLGKDIIAASIAIFGMNPFGFRFAGVIFGMLGLLVIYLFSKRIFDKTTIATGTLLLFAFDFMHFTQSRIGTVDAFTVVFVMLAFYFMVEFYAACVHVKKMPKILLYLLLSGMFFAMAGSVKWNSLYCGIGLLAIYILSLVRLYKKVDKNEYWKKLTVILLCSVACYIIIPILIYLLAYIPFVRATRKPGFIKTVLDSQKSMYSYHSQLTATHPFQSNWWEWMIDKRPLWYSYNTFNNGLVSSISAFGNPLIWWSGLLSIIVVLCSLIKKRSDIALILLFAYFSQLIPWMFIKRVTFIYHYYNMTPFLILMISYCINLYEKHEKYGKKKWPVYTFYALCGILFIIFFPAISGMPVEKDYLKHVLTWFSSWTFFN